ncbi:ribonuclease domain-containing protein [Streptomyces sp. NRRL S-350]|uniref:ribonuclease domain-containing protein n=1 Tax=Streptomyces sp. NRRL S-350 TaxID=1463902 RepID=UPI0004C0FCE1|nr:ribonuclease domain-containing protein [Streptomyces sp. NRRL S-350]
MLTRRHPQLSWTKRFAVLAAAIASVLGMSVLYSPAASAAVHNSCAIAGCSAAASANSTWSAAGYPTSRGWYDWPDGQCSFAGGEFYNNDGQLPAGDTFHEYDVYPRACGDHRDAYRIVVDANTGVVWYSPNHYRDFYRL